MDRLLIPPEKSGSYLLDSLKQAIVPLDAISVRNFDCDLLLDLPFRRFAMWRGDPVASSI